MTRVISVKGLTTAESKALLATGGFFYCGRNVRWWRDRGLGNPFHAAHLAGGPGAATRLYAELLTRGASAARLLAVHAYARIPEIPEAADLDAARRRAVALLPDLAGSTLGCWCGAVDVGAGTWPRCLIWAPPCHAVVLAAAAEGLIDVPGYHPEPSLAEG